MDSADLSLSLVGKSVDGEFGVDKRTGFVPPLPPLPRLPAAWGVWETNLYAAISAKLQLADAVVNLVDVNKRKTEESKSKEWRDNIEKVRLVALSVRHCYDRL